MTSHLHRALPSLLTLLILCLLPALPAAALVDGATALGSDGVLYDLEATTYGEAFPDGGAAPAENHVLVFTVTRPDGRVERQVVPGTETRDYETNPTLLAEPGTDSVFLLWENWQAIHHSFKLSAYSDAGWLDPIDVTHSLFVLKSSPQMAVTRDQVLVEGSEGATTRIERTVIHLAWIENEGTADERIVYSPQLLVDGELAATGRSISLQDLLPADAPASAEAAPIQSSISLRPGGDQHGIVIAYGDRGSGRIVSVQLTVLPGELSYLADGLREHLLSQVAAEVELGAAELDALAEGARAFVLGTGAHLRDSVISTLADLARDTVLDLEPGITAETAGREVRNRLIEAGGEADRTGIKRVTGPARPQWIDVGVRHDTPDHPGGGDVRSYQMMTRVVRTEGAPKVMEEQPVSMLVAPDGEDLALYWHGDGALHYVESADQGDGWREPSALQLDERMSAQEALELLQKRVDFH